MELASRRLPFETGVWTEHLCLRPLLTRNRKAYIKMVIKEPVDKKHLLGDKRKSSCRKVEFCSSKESS